MSRITLIGAGAIGCAVGGALLQAGHEVTFCARKAFARLSVQKDGEPPVVHVAKVVTRPDQVPQADWVLLCVKAYQVPSAAEWLAAAVRPGTRVAVLQNGVEQKENAEPFVPVGTPIVPVVIDLPVSRTAPGEVHWSRIATATVPEGPDGAAFAGLFAGSFLTAETSAEFVTRAWLKLCNNAPSGAILALTGQRMRVMHEPGIADLARAILAEVIAVGRAEGAELDDSLIERQVQFFLGAKGDEGNSMFADRMAGREMEWNARNAVIVRKAALHGIPVPVSTALVPLLAAISNAAKGD
ncbi:2-dehydropantoate 2-reductase [Rhizomicrobium electricum]|uniref:2-dehydropantoate 2-reductase n=1 Tax=Rhizomicrobium electricum TaxID=480070 RepID=A0ABN1EZC4_9PROT|nr:2-dehydropantoate 2-reductase [Rhizomicrobium electricum]NIJ50088.1 2-dehydropantoate 2-reductase [Rhizomicrobium electricum]